VNLDVDQSTECDGGTEGSLFKVRLWAPFEDPPNGLIVSVSLLLYRIWTGRPWAMPQAKVGQLVVKKERYSTQHQLIGCVDV
jgi:hypothetical protein